MVVTAGLDDPKVRAAVGRYHRALKGHDRDEVRSALMSVLALTAEPMTDDEVKGVVDWIGEDPPTNAETLRALIQMLITEVVRLRATS